MKLFYRFRKDDGTFPLDSEAKVFMRGQRIYEKYEHTLPQMHIFHTDKLFFAVYHLEIMERVEGNGYSTQKVVL